MLQWLNLKTCAFFRLHLCFLSCGWLECVPLLGNILQRHWLLFVTCQSRMSDSGAWCAVVSVNSSHWSADPCLCQQWPPLTSAMDHRGLLTQLPSCHQWSCHKMLPTQSSSPTINQTKSLTILTLQLSNRYFYGREKVALRMIFKTNFA